MADKRSALRKIMADLDRATDSLDRWHRPGAKDPMDKAYKQLRSAYRAAQRAHDHYTYGDLAPYQSARIAAEAEARTTKKQLGPSDMLTKKSARLARRAINAEPSALKEARLYAHHKAFEHYQRGVGPKGKLVKSQTFIVLLFNDGTVANVRDDYVTNNGNLIRGRATWKGTGRTFKAALTRMDV